MKKIIVSILVAATLALGVVACSPKADPTPDPDPAPAVPTKDDPYVSDEICMSCHGGSREAIVALTADYSDSNPHLSIHTEQYSCGDCHVNGSQKPTAEQNKCTTCHAWPRDIDSRK